MPNILLFLSAMAAGYFDVRWRRIPNWLVAITVITCLSWHGYMNGRAGIGASLVGLMLGLAILFPFFLLRGMGAGDVKYFGAIGAGVTAKHIVSVLVISLLIAGVISAFQIVRRRRLKESAKNTLALVRHILKGRLEPHPIVDIDNETAVLVPFTLATSIATCVVMIFSPAVL